MHVNEDDNNMDFEDYGKFVKINGKTYIRCKIETDCEYPYECVRHELVLRNGINYIECHDTEGHIVAFPYITFDVFAGETIKQRAMHLRMGDEVYAKQKFCPVVGCRNRRTHVANEQCVIVKLTQKPVEQLNSPNIQRKIMTNFGIPLCVEIVKPEKENAQRLDGVERPSIEGQWSRSAYDATTSPTYVGNFASPPKESYRRPKRRYVHAKRQHGQGQGHGYPEYSTNNFF